jgi:glc operon protein GlcG
MRLEQALRLINDVVAAATAPVSVFVSDERGEIVAAACMDGAAPDTSLNAQRKAYTVARSRANSTRELSQLVGEDPAELASFDPFYCFFIGGIAVFEGGRKIGALGVSGLTGDEDEALALAVVAQLRSSD